MNSLDPLLGLALLLTSLWFVTQQESRFLIHVYVITDGFRRRLELRGLRHPLPHPRRDVRGPFRSPTAR